MRVKTNVARHRRQKRLRKAARGARGARSKLFRTAKEGVMRGMQYAYIGRKLRKRDFRRLWIQRINAAARERGLSYSQLMGGLARAEVAIDRRTMADLAISDPAAFDEFVEIARGEAVATS